MSEIFIITPDQKLVSLAQRPYATEDLLQSLLANYPNLLAGDQIQPDAPRRWMLVKREASIPGEEDGAGRWSLDHLFLDQDGIPTLVEVKRSTDTRIRREVVGQMLDYAANGVKYWPLDVLRAHFEATCQASDVDPDTRVAELIGSDADPEKFWVLVKTNLQAGRIRMLFVADEIPDELRRVIEFLNEQMDPAEVLGVEIKQFANATLQTLVPRVLGQTVEAEDRKRVAAGRVKQRWDESSFLSAMETRHGSALLHTARRVLDWAKQNTTEVWWGRGTEHASFVPVLVHGGQRYQAFALFTGASGSSPYIDLYFYFWARKAPFDDPEMRRKVVRQLNEIPGLSFPDDAADRRPNFPLEKLTNEDALARFLKVMDFYLAEVRKTSVNPAA